MTSGYLGIPCYITLINNIAHNSDVDNMTYDKTRHNNVGTFVLLLVCMSSCSVARWWMSSWCVTTSPPHGKVCRVFDGHWVSLMVHSHVSPCLYFRMVDMFLCLRKVYARLSVREHIFACRSVCPSTNTYLHGRLFVNTSIYMRHLFICSWTCPFSCTPLVHPIYHHAVMICVPVSAMIHEKMTSNP